MRKYIFEEGYCIAEILKATWHDIMEFALAHDWGDKNGNEEWYIFNCNRSTSSFYLSPFMYGTDVRGDVLAEIKVKEISDEKVAVYWFPGFKGCYNNMEGFDNKLKWKADFTRDWFVNKLLAEIEKQKERNRPWWRKKKCC